MGNAADTLVRKYPDRIKQLKGPVYTYLKRWSPYHTAQSLYMAVFYPAARSWPVNKSFPGDVKRKNPGIKKVSDYMKKVESAHLPSLSAGENRALAEVADKLNVSQSALYKLIAFESGWNPQARNRKSGARGLIQFTPSTSKGMGFKGGLSVTLVTLILGVLYIIKKRKP